MFPSDEVETTDGGKYEEYGNEVEENQDTSLEVEKKYYLSYDTLLFFLVDNIV